MINNRPVVVVAFGRWIVVGVGVLNGVNMAFPKEQNIKLE